MQSAMPTEETESSKTREPKINYTYTEHPNISRPILRSSCY